MLAQLSKAEQSGVVGRQSVAQPGLAKMPKIELRSKRKEPIKLPSSCTQETIVSTIFGVICFIEVVALIVLVYYILQFQNDVGRYKKVIDAYLAGVKESDKPEKRSSAMEKGTTSDAASSLMTETLYDKPTMSIDSPRDKNEKKKNPKRNLSDSFDADSTTSETKGEPNKKKKKGDTPKADPLKVGGNKKKTDKGTSSINEEPKSTIHPTGTEPMPVSVSAGSGVGSKDDIKKNKSLHSKRDSLKKPQASVNKSIDDDPLHSETHPSNPVSERTALSNQKSNSSNK